MTELRLLVELGSSIKSSSNIIEPLPIGDSPQTLNWGRRPYSRTNGSRKRFPLQHAAYGAYYDAIRNFGYRKKILERLESAGAHVGGTAAGFVATLELEPSDGV